jgi:putative addiction module killer protein
VSVVDVRETAAFARSLAILGDPHARARVLVRIQRLSLGNPGDVAPVGEGVMEMRIRYGPGYRLYFVWRSSALAVLLCGGDKRTQARDIARARRLATAL